MSQTISHLDLKAHCETVWGEHLAVLGSWNNWNKSSPTLLQTTSQTYPLWTLHLPLSPTTTSLEYKYAIIRNGNILRWEQLPHRHNRLLTLPTSAPPPIDHFGHLDILPPPSPSPSPSPPPLHLDGLGGLDALEKAVVRANANLKSWRQRLTFITSLFSPPSPLSPSNLSHLITIAIYLTFLSTSQIPCHEDGTHHRPNHHAHQARLLEHSLSTLPNPHPYTAHIVRTILPYLPSHAPQFTASVPLTRIRDIAHRSDIPKPLKTRIKHTLQNKLHRCASPADLQTSEQILHQIRAGDYSPAFVEQFEIFHKELRAFFNAADLDDRLRFLSSTQSAHPVASLSKTLLHQKLARTPALPQLQSLTALRAAILQLPLLQPLPSGVLPSPDLQATRLADIALERYAFPLLSGLANEIEAAFSFSVALPALALSVRNTALSNLLPTELHATADELAALPEPAVPADWHRAKAAVSRVHRFTHDFSAAISDLYTRRAASLGSALGVSQHAIAVFAEAQIRANTTFQSSRLADAAAAACRQALQLPPWDPLCAGRACGRVVRVQRLADVRAGAGDVVVCREAEGDEDLPLGVRAVVLGRALPHLSHLGVRVRQAAVAFVCAEQQAVFQRVWDAAECRFAEVVVGGREGLRFAKIGEGEVRGDGEGKVAERTVGEMVREVKISFDGRVRRPLRLAEVSVGAASAKCSFAGRLFQLAQESNGLFEAADGVALPHGMFQAQREKHAAKYSALIKRYIETCTTTGGNTDSAGNALFEFVQSNFVLDETMCAVVQAAFEQDARVMVRSSANAEDLDDMSGAGLYDSLANVAVHDTAALQAATASVWASLWTKRAASSRASYNVPHDQVSMAVLVQQMVRADLSFVAFSSDPVSKDGDGAVYVEIAVGMGETLASAGSAGSPYRFRVARGGMQVETVSFASYGEALVPDEGGSGLRKKTVNYSKEKMTVEDRFREQLVQRIAKTVVLLEAKFGGPQDVEGAVTVSGDIARVFVVQARPQIL